MNSLKSFVLALGACIGVPTYFMVLRPYSVERERQPVAYDSAPPADNPTATPNDPAELKGLYYPSAFPGDHKRGELVYIREGCAQCHTQVVRPDYAGIDQIKRYGGQEQEYADDSYVVVRQTYPWDYMHEDFAMFGTHRIGPDLSNLRYRYLKFKPKGEPDYDKSPIDPEKVAKLYQYLYAPRSLPDRDWTNSPSFKHLFETKKKETAQGRSDAIKLPAELMPAADEEIIPTDDAKDLVEYLLHLKRTEHVPFSITKVKPEEKK
jgi:cbb3-type cytochrome oxidase cytochrome c subunit